MRAKNIGSVLNQLTPHLLGLSLYHLIFQTFCTSTWYRFPQVKLWARNSFYMKNIEPFLSDIDLTAVLNSEINAKEARALCQFHQSWQKKIPLLGELNVYHPRSVDLALACINSFELDRDPALKKLSRNQSLKENSAQKLSFLLRQLESDCHQLQKHNPQRERKWRAHFTQVLAAPAPEDCSWPKLLEAISMLVSASGRPSFLSELAPFFERKSQKKDAYFFEQYIYKLPWLLAAFPNHFCYTKNSLPPLSLEQVELLNAQGNWEAFGGLSQHFNFSDPHLFPSHLSNLASLVTRIENPNLTELQKSLTLAIELIQELEGLT